MKDFLKYNTIPVIGIVFLFFYFSKEESEISNAELLRQLNQRDTVLRSEINNMGQRVFEATNRSYAPIIIKESNNAEFADLRSRLNDLDIKIDDVNSVHTVSSTAFGKDSTYIYIQDTSKLVYSFEDSTDFLKISGNFSLLDSKLYYDYQYQNKLSLYSYEYKKKLFGNPELRLKLVSDDPNVNITTQTFNVQPPKKLFDIGVGLGMSAIYDQGFKVRPSINIGIYKGIIPIYRK